MSEALSAVLQHCDALSVTTVQPRQGRLKVARQELPGQHKKHPVPLGTAEATMAHAMSYHTRMSLLFHCVFSTKNTSAIRRSIMRKGASRKNGKMFLKKHALVEAED